MPFVKSHTRKGKSVKAHFRLKSRFNFGVGLLLLVLLFTYINKHQH